MSTISDDLLDSIEFLINKYRLHMRMPVDIGPLLERFSVSKLNFTPTTLGMALVRPKQMYIGINKNLEPTWQRMALAHEAGHIIANQPHSLFVCKTSDWAKERDEREAQIIAACLLVPLKVIKDDYQVTTAPQLAKLLRVPPDLVDLRWSFARVHGDI
ncbi:MAG: ImmA/IrrE family metallo-endopeptidase [Chloroflexota bacterium]|nr:ImmA/IrrE family metallo-endopeptidase [Chloroflexota bacterium]